MPINYANKIFNTVLQNLASPSSPQRTRKMGLVDLGTATDLAVGTSTVVGDLEQLALLMPTTSATYLAAQTYFNNTITSTPQINDLTIINIGAPIGTGGVASTLTCSTLGAVEDFQKIIDGAFSFSLYNSTENTTFNITDLDFTTITTEQDIVDILNNHPVLKEIAVVSLTAGAIVLTSKDITNGTSFTSLTNGGQGTDISGEFYLNGQGSNATITNGSPAGLNYSGCVDTLTNYLQADPDTAPYVIAIPTGLVQNQYFLGFLTTMLTTNPYTRFLSDYTTTTPGNDVLITGLLNKTNIIMIYKSFTTEYAYTAMLGRLSQYIGSTTYIMNNCALSPIVGVQSANLNTSQKAAFKANNFNYVQLQSPTIPVPTLQLGVFMDGTIYTDIYGTESTKFFVDEQLNNFIYQSNNTPGLVLKYNESGLKTLRGVISVQLNQCVAYGWIDSYDNVNYIPYLEYKAANPQDVAQGIYNGFTVNINKAGFFTSITLFAKIGV
jgi:hypothetical protein